MTPTDHPAMLPSMSILAARALEVVDTPVADLRPWGRNPARRTRDRTQTTLWEINLDQNVAGGHSTQKPVECMARAIRNHDFPDVYDPFLGSGTTVVAAEMEGRRCFGLELVPAYCDVIRQRYADYVGDPQWAP